MGNPIITTIPSRTFNWADDDDDDFDLDVWKANTAHISAPSLEELGSLQLPLDEEPLLVTIANKSSAPKAQQQPPPEAPELPEDTAAWPLEAHEDVGYQYYHKIEERLPDPPAYPELSAYEDETPSPYVRKNYANHWTAMKLRSGKDCRVPVLYKSSRLVEVQCAYKEDIDVTTTEEKNEGGIPSEQCCTKVQCDEEEVAYNPQLPVELSPFTEYILGQLSEDDTPPSSLENSYDDIKAILQDAKNAYNTKDANTHNLYDELSEMFPNNATNIADGDFDFSDLFAGDDDDDSDASSSDDGNLSSSPPPSRDEGCISSSPPPSLETESERKQNPVELVSQPIIVRLPPLTAFTNSEEATSPTVYIQECIFASSCAEAAPMERHDFMDALDGCNKCASQAIEPEVPTTHDESKEQSKILQESQPQPTHQPSTLYSTFQSQFAEDGNCALTTYNTPSHKICAPVPASATHTTLSGFKDADITHSVSDYISSAVSTSLLTLSSQPWTAAGIATAGVVLGGLIQFARRR